MKAYQIALAALASVVPWCNVSQAATFTQVPGRADVLRMEGRINWGDEKRFAAILTDRWNRGQVTEWLVLNSIGGNAHAGTNIGWLARSLKIKTSVGAEMNCVSSCFTIFASGVERWFASSAAIGVHSAGYRDAEGNSDEGKSEGSMAATLELARYLTSVGTPPTIVTKLISTENTSITWLATSDVAGWATEFEDKPIKQPEPEPQVAETNTTSMYCFNGRVRYPVVWLSGGMYVNNLFYPISTSHQHSVTEAWVVSGPTKYGTYSAVLGGPNPRVEYRSDEGKVIDLCR